MGNVARTRRQTSRPRPRVFPPHGGKGRRPAEATRCGGCPRRTPRIAARSGQVPEDPRKSAMRAAFAGLLLVLAAGGAAVRPARPAAQEPLQFLRPGVRSPGVGGGVDVCGWPPAGGGNDTHRLPTPLAAPPGGCAMGPTATGLSSTLGSPIDRRISSSLLRKQGHRARALAKILPVRQRSFFAQVFREATRSIDFGVMGL